MMLIKAYKKIKTMNYFALESFGQFAGELIFIFLDIFSKAGTYLHL